MKHLKYGNLFRFYEFIQPFINYSMPLEKKLPANKVLVIAPNQIDEAVGCAGTILKHTKKGGTVEIVYCTHESTEKMKESEKAASLLGSKRNHFMQFPVKSLDGSKDFNESLVKLFNKVQPEVVFLPFWIDNNSDHIALSKALINIKRRIELNFTVYAYSVWTPLNPNAIFDISSVWKEKQKVIECYQTQLATKNFVKISQGMNQYWGEMKTPGMEYAESFFTASIQQYISLGKKIFR